MKKLTQKSKLLLIGILILSLMAMPALGCTATDPLTDDLYTDSSFMRIDSDNNGGYLHEYSLDAINLSSGGSGATQISPNASSLGGYQLNSIAEYLFFTTHCESDWDGIGDGFVEIYFEVNVDNSGGLDADTVKFQLESWHKLEGERTNTAYPLEGTTIVGKAGQHDLFKQEVVVGNLRAGEAIAFRLNLNTVLSDVTDVIVNYVEFKYPTYLPAVEK